MRGACPDQPYAIRCGLSMCSAGVPNFVPMTSRVKHVQRYYLARLHPARWGHLVSQDGCCVSFWPYAGIAVAVAAFSSHSCVVAVCFSVKSRRSHNQR